MIMQDSEKLNTIFPGERRQQILQIVENEGRITVTQIQRLFCVGYETAKKDLAILENENKLKRVHGGAVQNSSNLIPHCENNDFYNAFCQLNKKRIYFDHSVVNMISLGFRFTNDYYYTNSLVLAQNIVASGFTVKVVVNHYAQDTFSYSNLMPLDIMFDLCCIAMFYDADQKCFWIDSSEKHKFYLQIVRKSKLVLVSYTTLCMNITDEIGKNNYKFTLNNAINISTGLLYFTNDKD